MALVETWPDGRIIYHLTTAKRAWMWTPLFPRVDGYQPPPDRKPVAAVLIVRTLVGAGVQAEVSVLLGTPQPPGVPVATVVVAPGAPVIVHELARFGVQPVTLSIAEVAAFTPYLPTMVSASPQIEITAVESYSAPYPGYRFTLRNMGSKAVSSIHVQTYRGDEKALSALKRNEDGRPMMPPGATYSFDVNLTSGTAREPAPAGTWVPRPLDLVEFDSVRWEDGSYDGVSPHPGVDAAVEANSGRRLQLRRIIEVLERALVKPSRGELVAEVNGALERLPDAEADQLAAAQAAMRSTKAIARADLSRFERGSSAAGSGEVRQRLETLLQRYRTWLARMSPP